MKEYTTNEVMQIVDMERESFRSLTNYYNLHPIYQSPGGHGRQNLYSQWDIYGIAVFQILRKTFHGNYLMGFFNKWRDVDHGEAYKTIYSVVVVSTMELIILRQFTDGPFPYSVIENDPYVILKISEIIRYINKKAEGLGREI